MHKKNNKKKFFIVILKKHKNQRDNKNLIVNALNKIIFEINYLKNIIQQFVKVTKYKF